MAMKARATNHRPIRFDDLPLFVAKDSDLAEAIVGADPERKQVWLAGLPRLEASGFPRVTPGQGRYRPAVKAFYDRFYSLDAAQANATHQEGGTWTPRKRSRHPA